VGGGTKRQVAEKEKEKSHGAQPGGKLNSRGGKAHHLMFIKKLKKNRVGQGGKEEKMGISGYKRRLGGKGRGSTWEVAQRGRIKTRQFYETPDSHHLFSNKRAPGINRAPFQSRRKK